MCVPLAKRTHIKVNQSNHRAYHAMQEAQHEQSLAAQTKVSACATSLANLKAVIVCASLVSKTRATKVAAPARSALKGHFGQETSANVKNARVNQAKSTQPQRLMVPLILMSACASNFGTTGGTLTRQPRMLIVKVAPLEAFVQAKRATEPCSLALDFGEPAIKAQGHIDVRILRRVWVVLSVCFSLNTCNHPLPRPSS
jgi:hypothetical protein